MTHHRESNSDGSPPDWELLDRYVSGTASRSEADSVDAFFGLSKGSARAELFARALRAPNVYPPGISPDEAVRRVRAMVDTRPNRGSSPITGTGVRRRAAWSWGAGAAASLTLIGAAVMSHLGGHSRDSRAAANGEVFTTAVGERATVTLADGSRVTLAPQTSLRVDAEFGKTSRQVSLVGEAYFDIQHKDKIPFSVTTNGATARVIGTAFNVARYASDSRTTVAVISGKIALVANGATREVLTLSAGEVAQATDSSTKRTDDAAAQRVAWTTGRLVFRDAPVREVLAALTRWYGYEFRLGDVGLEERHLTVGVSTESSSAALASLKQVLDVDLAIDGNVITLRPKRATRVPVPTRNTKDLIGTPQMEVGR